MARRKLSWECAQDLWKEIALLAIRQTAFSFDVPELLALAVRHNINVYDVCHLQAARMEAGLPVQLQWETR